MESGNNICKLKCVFFVCFISVIYFTQSYSYMIAGNGLYRLFHCKSGEYVQSHDVCDEVKDCVDGSDENQCHCGFGRYLCPNSTTNTTCIDAKLLCDTRKDCPDGSDENNCGDEIKVHDCPLSKGKFLCKDNLRCLNLEYTCDTICNCFDCSDENENCTKITDYQSFGRPKCSHTYFPTPSGLRCFCNSANGEFDDLCNEIKDCTGQSSPCDQRCSKYKSKVLCSCHDDFFEVPVRNGFKCRSKEYYGTNLIYSTSNHIKALNVTSKEITVIKSNVQSEIIAAALNVIYYTTYRDDSKSIFMISSDNKTTEIIKLNSSIISIAVDYITNNVYFTTDQSLSVCSKKGEICVQLKCCDVAHVALAPKFGWMFYTKKSDIPNENFIMKANMDGSNENIFIDGTFRNAILVTVDESFGRLYWLQRNKISSISLHDNNIETHSIRQEHNLASLAVLDEILFYTSERDNKIYQLETLQRFVKSSNEYDERSIRYYDSQPSDTNYTLLRDAKATISIKNLTVYNTLRQLAFKNKNPCDHAQCSGFCLLHPSSDANPKNGPVHKCVCNDFIPSDGDHWCTDFLLVIDPFIDSDQHPNVVPENDTSFVEILFILMVLAAVIGGVYFIYRKYYSEVMYSRQSRVPGEKIYDSNQSEF